jgi:DNA-damage-inducible protein D
MSKELTVFEEKSIRRYYDAKNETWYFSLVDIVGALTDSVNPTDYLKKMRKRDEDLNFYLGTNCPQVEMSSNGKSRKTLAGNTENVLRLVQAIPSSKAEPFKLWLAKVGHERLKEIQDPGLSIDRARENWRKKGRTEKWIQQRMAGQEIRDRLTDYWKANGVEGYNEFAFLTNIIHQEWTDMTINNHKELKGLKSQNLRDHMSETELVFSSLAEMAANFISEKLNANGLVQNAKASKKGGAIAKKARVEFESKTGKSVITGDNFLATAKGKKSKKLN